MNQLNLPVSAKLMRYWFAGKSNYSKTSEDRAAGIDQNGNPFTAEMINDDLITLKWVRSYPRAEKIYKELLSTAIFSPNAANEIRKKLLAAFPAFLDPYTPLNCFSTTGQNLHSLHRDFQFQLSAVDSAVTDKAVLWVGDETGGIKAPDDLTGALGSFAIYAAIGDIYISRVTNIACVDSVYIYARDSYSFLDNDESSSQYLGHWSTENVYLAPILKTSAKGAFSWINTPLTAIGRSIFEKGGVMYPVANKNFRDWREKHNQGGDFLIYTTPQLCRLQVPISVSLR